MAALGRRLSRRVSDLELQSAGRPPGSSEPWPRSLQASGAYLGLSSTARPAVAKHSVPLKTALADAEQLLEQNKDWIKNEFDGKLKELEKKRESMVRDAEETLGATGRASFRPATRSKRKRPTRRTPPGSSRFAYGATKGSRRPRNTSPAHRGTQGKIRKGSPGARRVLSKDKRDHQASLRSGLGQPDQELDRGNGQGRPHRERSSRGSRAPIPGMGRRPSSTAGSRRSRCHPACASACSTSI